MLALQFVTYLKLRFTGLGMGTRPKLRDYL